MKLDPVSEVNQQTIELQDVIGAMMRLMSGPLDQVDTLSEVCMCHKWRWWAVVRMDAALPKMVMTVDNLDTRSAAPIPHYHYSDIDTIQLQSLSALSMSDS